MKKSHLAGLLGLSLVAACATDDDTQTASLDQGIEAPADRLSAPLTSLTRASRQPLGFVVRDGVPVAVTGSIEVAGATPVERARAFLARYPSLYSDAALDLPVRRSGSSTVDRVTLDHVILYQRIGGVDVYGAELSLLFNGSTFLGAGGWVLPDVPTIELRPTFDADLAEAAARSLGGQGVLAATPKLFVYDRRAFESVHDRHQAPTVLVWQVVVGGEQFLIDARDASLVRRDAHVEEISTQIYNDANGDEIFDNGCLIASCSSIVNTLGSSFVTAYNFYKNRFGWVGYDGDDNENEVYTNSADPTAYYSNWVGDEYFKFMNGQVSVDIIGHEFTHGVIDHKCDLDSGNEPGALNESFADLMGNVVEGNLPSKVGENSTNGALRDQCNPTAFGIPGTMAGFIPGGEVHAMSGIPSNAWCKTSLLLQGAGNTTTTTRNKIADTAMALFDSMPSDATFAVTATLAMATAQAFFGAIGSNPLGHGCLVHDAWKAVGVDVSGPFDIFCTSGAADDDGDGVQNTKDNCRNVANPSQKDTDGDGKGDLCDPDIDGDGVPNASDNCVLPNPDQKDKNGNGKGDACEDFDKDGVLDDVDNCMTDYNPGQADSDGDGTGNICEVNNDKDGKDDNNDNCQFVDNNDQADADGDGLGDACDPCPNTYAVPTAWTAGNAALGIKPKPLFPDSDGDGTPDACDGSPFGKMKMNGGMAKASTISPGTKVTIEGNVSGDSPLLIPFEPCPRGGCAKFDDAMPIILTITGADRMRVMAVDDRGKVVASMAQGKITLAPRGGRTYRLAVTSKVDQAVSMVVVTTGGER